jgi:DNA polymerase-1
METFRAYCDNVKDWCKRVHGIDNPGSNQQVVRALQKLGVQFVKTTPGGAVSLDGDVLEWVADTASGAAGELATAVLRRRQLEKISSTYLSNLLALAGDDDVLHPGINPLGFSQRKEQRGSGYGVRTGRMSMENPNLQNLPRRGGRNPGGDVVRSCFTAREGHTLLMCDFDQIEMRIFTHLSQDPGLIAAFHSENDFFVELARRIFRDDTIEKKDPRRQITKNSGYAKIYGAGLAKFAATAGITIEHASAVMTEFDRLFPRGVAHSNGVMRAARETRLEEGVGYVTSPITDRRFTIDEGKEFALVNHQIQGAAAELFKMKLIQLDDAGLGDWLIVPVHDEIISDVPNDDVHDAVHVLQKVMNDDQLLSVPVSASVSHGPSWGDKSDWNECDESCLT